jgi:hypothetical protein
MLPTPTAASAGADLAHVESDAQRSLADNEPPPQQCGRCRMFFEGDPTLYRPARPDWWLCPPCRAILLGGSPRPDNVAHRRRVGEP